MVQAVGEVHDTPLKPAPGTLGVCWIDQAVPFHASASVELPESVVPTAMQNVAEVQETPTSELRLAPEGLGVFRTDHAVPFQDSASVTPAPARSCRPPTAMQVLGEVHETAASWPWLVSGLGVG